MAKKSAKRTKLDRPRHGEMATFNLEELSQLGIEEESNLNPGPNRPVLNGRDPWDSLLRDLGTSPTATSAEEDEDGDKLGELSMLAILRKEKDVHLPMVRKIRQGLIQDYADREGNLTTTQSLLIDELALIALYSAKLLGLSQKMGMFKVDRKRKIFSIQPAVKDALLNTADRKRQLLSALKECSTLSRKDRMTLSFQNDRREDERSIDEEISHYEQLLTGRKVVIIRNKEDERKARALDRQTRLRSITLERTQEVLPNG